MAIDRRVFSISLGASVMAPTLLKAQTSSGGTLSFIVPQPPGNPTDILARRLHPGIQRGLGQTIVVENLPGAGGALGVNKMLASQSNTLTLMIASQTESILSPLSVRAAKYSSDKLRPVLLVTRGPYILLGRSDLAARDFKELTQLAQDRQRENKPLTFGHIGNGSMIHILGERLSRKAGFALTQVPYKGVPPILQDLIGGQIDLTFVPQSSVRDLASTGKVKIYGTSGPYPSSRLPDALPFSKQGSSLTDFVHSTWAAVFVSKFVAEEEVQRIHKVLTATCHEAQFQSQILAGGSDPAPPMSLNDLDKFFDGEVKLYQALAREIGIQPE